MLDRARRDLAGGAAAVVLDGSYARRSDRARVLKLAEEEAAIPLFILCYCSDAEVKRRLERRANDPDAVSDGRWEIYVVQKERFEAPGELAPGQLLRLDTEADPALLVEKINRFIAALA
jgi:predicted kinase